MITDGSSSGFTGNAGFNGIVVALFAQLHPILSIPASMLFGALLVGANSMQRAVQVPSAFVIALNGLIVVFVVSSEFIRRRRQRQRLAATKEDESPPSPDQVPSPPVEISA
jgi:simple sugar transport system permease protein